jgi:hypothetical protein
VKLPNWPSTSCGLGVFMYPYLVARHAGRGGSGGGWSGSFVAAAERTVSEVGLDMSRFPRNRP